MCSQPFRKLLALVELDRSVSTELSRRTHIDTEIDAQELKLDELELSLRNFKTAVVDARKNVDAIELELRSLEQKESRKKKLIDVANNLKEFNSAKVELASVHEQMQRQEEAVVKAWDILEQTQKALSQFEAGYQASLDAIKQSISEKFAVLQTVDAAIENLKSKRPAYQAEVPEEWLSQYATMHSAVDNPVTPLYDDACSACYAPVPSQLMSRINKGAVLPCKSCFRLLYAPSMHSATARE